MTIEHRTQTPSGDGSANAEQIMFAAMELFARKGYAGTSVREIVQAAQVTNPMLYYYFDSKQGLFDTLVTHLMESWHQNVAEIVQQDSELHDKVVEIVRRNFVAFRENPYGVRFIYSVIFGPIDGRRDDKIRRVHAETLALVAQMFEAAQQTGTLSPSPRFSAIALSERLLGLIGTELIRALVFYEQLPPDKGEAFLVEFSQLESVEGLVEFFLNGAQVGLLRQR